ncbi:hypothetical protein [Tautonia marina]|uniref:hypothetical protein n=1 Tax=Tautonia marina TaxID=2653855 RepID=UPI001260EB5F|nr:hypothetical protein [Tautonia marina]
MKPYDNYEISGCQTLDGAGLPDPDGSITVVCDDDEAQFWTLYGHIEGEGVEAIGDFSSREAAEATYFRITGQPFPGSYQCDAHIRRMHLAREAFALLRDAANELEIWQLGCGEEGDPDTMAILRDAETLFGKLDEQASSLEAAVDSSTATVPEGHFEALQVLISALRGCLRVWDDLYAHSLDGEADLYQTLTFDAAREAIRNAEALLAPR